MVVASTYGIALKKFVLLTQLLVFGERFFMEGCNFGVRELAPAFKAAACRRTPHVPQFPVIKANRYASADEPPALHVASDTIA
jgi:hypothetical protein